MKPTMRLSLFLLIFLIVSGTAPAVHAQDCTSITAGSSIDNAQEVFCGVVDPTCYSGSILAKNPPQVDYYKIMLVAGQELIIDVDAETTRSSLDALLEVVETDEAQVDANNDQILDPNDPTNISLDPYLQVRAPADGDITYVIAISAGSDDPTSSDPSNSGPYTFSLKCSDPSIPPVTVEPVAVGDLLGSNGSVSGSLVTIDLVEGKSTFRFPLDPEPIEDLEYSYGEDTVFFATEGIPGSISTINPNNGVRSDPVHFDTGGFRALESAESELYGVYVENIEYDFDNITQEFSLVSIDWLTGSVLPVAELDIPIRALAYHSSEKVIYAVASIQNSSDLIKIRLEPQLSVESASAIPIFDDITGQVQVMALDFDHENVLYGVDDSGNLLKIDHTTGRVLENMPIEGSDIVNGLTFVVGEPPAVEPIKVICSSTLNIPSTASSEAPYSRFSKFRRKRNPLHRAIGLFKFQGKAFENITVRLKPEVEEPVETVEESSVSNLRNSWWKKWRGKGRVFLGIRDAIPDLKFRARKKDEMPFEMSAVLPADGTYYVMVIRPLLRFHKTDYCLTLESNYQDSEAWKTLEVAWPSDDSEESATSTSTEAKTAVVQGDEATDDGVSDSGDSTPGEPAGAVPAFTAVAPVSVAPVSSAPAPVGEGGSEEVKPVEEITVDDTEEKKADESPVTRLMNPEDEEDDREEADYKEPIDLSTP